MTSRSVMAAAARATRELEAQARPAGAFDPSRYFRTTEALGFLNVRTPIVRDLGKSIAKEHRDFWNVEDALRFADMLIRDRHLEVKGVGIDPEDLIQKAAGWLLRDAGRTDRPRLERYLRANGPSIPRTTLRYAVEHFPEGPRKAILAATRASGSKSVVRQPRRAVAESTRR